MKPILKKIVFVAFAALLVMGGLRALKQKREEEAKLAPAKVYPVTVKTLTAKTAPVTLTLPYVAEVRNDADVTLGAATTAAVTFCASPGEKVRKGQIVVRLDTRSLEAKRRAVAAEIKAAKAERLAARTELKTLLASHARTKKLLEVRGASKESFENEERLIAAAKARVEAAEAKLQSLRANLAALDQQIDYALIKAPIDGVVGQRFLNEGDMAVAGKPILRLNALKGGYLLVRLPERLDPLGLLYRNKRLTLQPLHQTERTLKLYRTPPIGEEVLTGQKADVRVVVFEGEAILLPPDALLSRGRNYLALVPEGDRARTVPVKVLAEGEEGVAIKAAQLEGKKVIVAKPDVLLRLTSGAPLSIQSQTHP